MKQEDLKRKLEELEVPQRNFKEMFEPVAEILSRLGKYGKIATTGARGHCLECYLFRREVTLSTQVFEPVSYRFHSES
jgi:hypothetical protein